MNIRLCAMTKDLCRVYMQGFVIDPALFADPAAYRPYVYEDSACDAYFQRHKDLGRIHLAIMNDEIPIGEIILKKIDYEQKHCTMGISMQCDRYKNQGYGTQAEHLALEYAFGELGLETVYADSLITNPRSQHVLEKAGFKETHRDDAFVYYICRKDERNSRDSG